MEKKFTLKLLDTLYPIVFEQVKITLISVGPYGCPEHSLTIAFSNEENCLSFMVKLSEARDQYQKIKQVHSFLQLYNIYKRLSIKHGFRHKLSIHKQLYFWCWGPINMGK